VKCRRKQPLGTKEEESLMEYGKKDLGNTGNLVKYREKTTS